MNRTRILTLTQIWIMIFFPFWRNGRGSHDEFQGNKQIRTHLAGKASYIAHAPS